MGTQNTLAWFFNSNHQDQLDVLDMKFQNVTPYPVFLLDAQSGSFPFIGKRLTSLLGYPPEVFMEEGLLFVNEIIEARDYRRMVTSYLKLLQQMKAPTLQMGQKFHERFRIFKHDRSPTTVEVYLAFYTEKFVEPHYFIGIIKEELKPIPANLPMAHIEDEKSFLALQRVSEMLKSHIAIVEGSLSLKEAKAAISSREIEILNLLSKGFSSKILASKLHISHHTVESHRKNLLDKFHVKNTAELIKVAHEYLS